MSPHPVARSKVSLCITLHHHQRSQSSSFVFVYRCWKPPTSSTRPATPLLPPICAVPQITATTVSLPPPRALAQCRCHCAAAVSLSSCRSVSADPSASPCTPCIVLHLLPDLFVLDRASSDAVAHQSPCARRTPHRTLQFLRGSHWLRCSCQVRSPCCYSSPFIGAPTTHVNSSISRNVFPFVKCSARFRSPVTRFIYTRLDIVTRNHTYFSMSIFPKPLHDAIAFVGTRPYSGL